MVEKFAFLTTEFVHVQSQKIESQAARWREQVVYNMYVRITVARSLKFIKKKEKNMEFTGFMQLEAGKLIIREN